MDKRDQVHRVTRESGAVTDWEHYCWCRNEVKRRLNAGGSIVSDILKPLMLV